MSSFALLLDLLRFRRVRSFRSCGLLVDAKRNPLSEVASCRAAGATLFAAAALWVTIQSSTCVRSRYVAETQQLSFLKKIEKATNVTSQLFDKWLL